MNNLSHLSLYENGIYARKCAKYENLSKIYSEKLDFDNFSYNAYARYLETGDVTHINRVLLAAKHVNRFREFRSLFKKLTAHPWKPGQNGVLDTEQKASKRKLNALRGAGTDKFLMEFQGDEEKRAKSTAHKKWDLDKRMESFLKSAFENGYSLADVQNAILSNRPHVSAEETRKAA